MCPITIFGLDRSRLVGRVSPIKSAEPTWWRNPPLGRAARRRITLPVRCANLIRPTPLDRRAERERPLYRSCCKSAVFAAKPSAAHERGAPRGALVPRFRGSISVESSLGLVLARVSKDGHKRDRVLAAILRDGASRLLSRMRSAGLSSIHLIRLELSWNSTRLRSGRDGCALRQTPPEGGVFPGNLVEHDHQVVLRNAGLGSDALI